MNEGTDPGVEEDSGVCGEGLTWSPIVRKQRKRS